MWGMFEPKFFSIKLTNKFVSLEGKTVEKMKKELEERIKHFWTSLKGLFLPPLATYEQKTIIMLHLLGGRLVFF